MPHTLPVPSIPPDIPAAPARTRRSSRSAFIAATLCLAAAFMFSSGNAATADLFDRLPSPTPWKDKNRNDRGEKNNDSSGDLPPSSGVSEGKPLPGGNSGVAHDIEEKTGVEPPAMATIKPATPKKFTEKEVRRLFMRTAWDDAQWTRNYIEGKYPPNTAMRKKKHETSEDEQNWKEEDSGGGGGGGGCHAGGVWCFEDRAACEGNRDQNAYPIWVNCNNGPAKSPGGGGGDNGQCHDGSWWFSYGPDC